MKKQSSWKVRGTIIRAIPTKKRKDEKKSFYDREKEISYGSGYCRLS